ncbi:uncharacterized protein GIQ15_04314 [Arthroderma uncinatum]|uniref:uncharacterized protein n=1 Tax=Arthroderma uncinatum TaxID=74035 RepID=UPI00144AD7EB|nr:uncharacterized protein GIQ15_04314 [Arthroderma uncinatum]KAF3481555.1 hypothetical protein GIQ15_04314 [Arthroderma uncinatum]
MDSTRSKNIRKFQFHISPSSSRFNRLPMAAGGIVARDLIQCNQICFFSGAFISAVAVVLSLDRETPGIAAEVAHMLFCSSVLAGIASAVTTALQASVYAGLPFLSERVIGLNCVPQDLLVVSALQTLFGLACRFGGAEMATWRSRLIVGQAMTLFLFILNMYKFARKALSEKTVPGLLQSK